MIAAGRRNGIICRAKKNGERENQTRKHQKRTHRLLFQQERKDDNHFCPPGHIPALGAPCPVAGAPESLRHALLCARQDVAAGAHGASDDDRLPRELVVDGDEGMVRRERAGGTLSVN